MLLYMRPSSSHHRRPTVEILENRRLMSVALAGAFAGHLPRILPVAGTSTISVHLTNTGRTKTVETATVQLFASNAPTPNSGEVLLATAQQNIRLNPRASTTARLTVPSPTTLPTGGYFLLAEVNGSLVTAAPVQIQSPFSDLAVSFAGLPNKPVEIDGPSAGTRVATVDVINDGNVPISGSINLSLYISANNVLDTNAAILQTLSNAKLSLKAGKGKAFQFQIAVPPGTAIGGYFLLAKATGNGTLANVTTTNSLAVSSRRIAVVNQLPTPVRVNNNTNVSVYTGVGATIVDDSGGCVCDNGSADDAVSYDDSGSYTTSDPSTCTDTSSSTDNSSSDSTGNDSTDSWGSGDDSSGGDF